MISNIAILFSNFSPKIPKLGIFGPKFKGFYIAPNFAIRQIRGQWFQIRQWLFPIAAQKYQNKPIFALNVSIFVSKYLMHEASHDKKFEDTISKMAIAFFKFHPKIHKY